MDIEGRTICITGGSRRIGRSLCDEFARHGAHHILVAGRSKGRLPNVIGGTPLSFVEVDLAQPSGVEDLARGLHTDFPDCSILVNNAGSQVLADCVAPDAAEMAAAIEQEIYLNFVAPVLLSLRLMPVLLKHKEAAICNITSGLALAPKQSAPVYCATKAGLSSFSRGLRYQAELRAPNLRVFEALRRRRLRGSAGLAPAGEGFDDGHMPAAARAWRTMISRLVGFGVGLLNRSGEPRRWLRTSGSATYSTCRTRS